MSSIFVLLYVLRKSYGVELSCSNKNNNNTYTLGGSLSVFLGLKNTVSVVLLSLVVIGVVL